MDLAVVVNIKYVSGVSDKLSLKSSIFKTQSQDVQAIVFVIVQFYLSAIFLAFLQSSQTHHVM